MLIRCALALLVSISALSAFAGPCTAVEEGLVAAVRERFGAGEVTRLEVEIAELQLERRKAECSVCERGLPLARSIQAAREAAFRTGAGDQTEYYQATRELRELQRLCQ